MPAQAYYADIGDTAVTYDADAKTCIVYVNGEEFVRNENTQAGIEGDGGEKIQIAGFGTFEQRQRNARTGCDPRTGKSIEIPASKVPAFKAGKGFKDVVNK